MNLYEIRTGMEGDSYERAYAWAESMGEALQKFEDSNPDPSRAAASIRVLMKETNAAFCTKISDNGWEEA